MNLMVVVTALSPIFIISITITNFLNPKETNDEKNHTP